MWGHIRSTETNENVFNNLINQQQRNTQFAVTSDHIAVILALQKKSNLGGYEQEGLESDLERSLS